MKIDDHMTEADLTAAADRIRASIDWKRVPKLAAMFEHRPSVNVYWHELVGLVLMYLERDKFEDVDGRCHCRRMTTPADVETVRVAVVVDGVPVEETHEASCPFVRAK